MKDILARSGDQHFAQLRAISLTLPTELGVCYSFSELTAWRKFANDHRLHLHWDGARLANFAAHHACPISELIRVGRPDSVAFGGTKNGLLELKPSFCLTMNGRRLLSIFANKACSFRQRLVFWRRSFKPICETTFGVKSPIRSERKSPDDLGEALRRFPQIEIAFPVHGNALFVKLPKPWIQPLKDEFFFYIWDADQNMARWMIGFDWKREFTERLLQKIDEVSKQCPV